MALFTLTTELNISPMEAAQLPASLVAELLTIFAEVELYKAEELNKASSEAKRNTLKSKGGMKFGR